MTSEPVVGDANTPERIVPAASSSKRKTDRGDGRAPGSVLGHVQDAEQPDSAGNQATRARQGAFAAVPLGRGPDRERGRRRGKRRTLAGLAALDEPVIDAHLPIRPCHWVIKCLRTAGFHLVFGEAEMDKSPDLGHSADRDSHFLAAPSVSFLEEHVGHMAAAMFHDQPLDLAYLAVGRTDGQLRRMSTSPAGTGVDDDFLRSCGRPGSRPVRAPDPPAPKTPGTLEKCSR